MPPAGQTKAAYLFSCALAVAAISLPAAADIPPGAKSMLSTAAKSAEPKVFQTVLQTALATWPGEREAILAYADALNTDLLTERQHTELTEVREEKVAAEAAQRARGMVYYIDPKLWAGQIDFGAGKTSGDSSETAATVGVSFKRTFGPKWEHAINLHFDYARNNEVTTREKYLGDYEVLWKNWEKLYLLSFTAFEVDQFSGYDYRILQNVGFGYEVFNNAIQQLRFEGGPGVRFNKLSLTNGAMPITGDTTETEIIARLAASYSIQLTEDISLKDKASVLLGGLSSSFDNLVEMTTRINSHLAGKASFQFKQESNAPEGTSGTDTITRLSLTYMF
ncbi:DUF481 domain-containing protein [Gimibacter soli]|uniref:DUF481 domain-containing protein n=1 Tax=Gimibacter soli TaxID=3024400 RepID=A0AAE9XVK5_9PROT|nr:DUF481 domain-containing protein [Gimibacter soli]WCL54708.1 DUF481 domain-containing protein [Gimibacter soli]